MVIIVTGGIGSGKSEVCRIIAQEYGFPVYEADRKAKELYVRYPELLSAIESSLDCVVRDPENVFQPRMLAERIFGDGKAVATVEELLFPYMLSDFKEFAESSGNIIIFESATVLEKHFFDGFGDKVILVDAPYPVRLERACRRDGALPETVMARMDGQKLMNAISEGMAGTFVPESSFGRAYARIDEIIMNNGSAEDLVRSVRDTMERLMADDIN